jgi:hypothetical protein
MLTRLSSEKTKRNIFWDGFFSVFGFYSNPLLNNVREITNKSVDQRMSESWGSASETFKETFEKQECVVNE